MTERERFMTQEEREELIRSLVDRTPPNGGPRCPSADAEIAHLVAVLRGLRRSAAAEQGAGREGATITTAR